jgi:hypothetical protein
MALSKTKKSKKACKGNKVPQGRRRYCVKPCKKGARRINYVCKGKAGMVLNELSGRYVKKSGPTGKWMSGKTGPPSQYSHMGADTTYRGYLRILKG